MFHPNSFCVAATQACSLRICVICGSILPSSSALHQDGFVHRLRRFAQIRGPKNHPLRDRDWATWAIRTITNVRDAPWCVRSPPCATCPVSLPTGETGIEFRLRITRWTTTFRGSYFGVPLVTPCAVGLFRGLVGFDPECCGDDTVHGKGELRGQVAVARQRICSGCCAAIPQAGGARRDQEGTAKAGILRKAERRTSPGTPPRQAPSLHDERTGPRLTHFVVAAYAKTR